MAQTRVEMTLAELAKALGGELSGPAEKLVLRPVPAGTADPDGVAFAASEKYLKQVLDAPPGAVLVPLECPSLPIPAIAVANPRASFGMVLGLFARPLSLPAGVHPTAVVHPSASVHESAAIGAYCVIEEGVEIGPGAQVMAHGFVGSRSRVGAATTLYPRVTLYQDVIVGERCLVHSGAVLGADGFGFVWDGAKQQKVPQVGRVVLLNDVEIGANTCIDRATCGDTVIGAGVKLDNLIQIAHNCTIGAHTVMASQVGISGSVIVGERCVLGGQVGIGDHAELEDDVMLAGKSGVHGRLAPGQYMGAPALEAKQAFRAVAAYRRLPELQAQVRDLAKKVNGGA